MIPDHNRHCDIATLSGFDIEDWMCVIGTNLDISREHAVASDVDRATLKSSHIDSPCRTQSPSDRYSGIGPDKNGASCITGSNSNFCITPSKLDHNFFESGIRLNYDPVASAVKLNINFSGYMASGVNDLISAIIFVIFQGCNSGRVHDLYNGAGLGRTIEEVSTCRSLSLVDFPHGVGHVWPYGLAQGFDAYPPGRRLSIRLFNVIGDFNRETLGIEIDSFTVGADDSLRECDRRLAWQGQAIWCVNVSGISQWHDHGNRYQVRIYAAREAEGKRVGRTM
jgi:hypothetical protein